MSRILLMIDNGDGRVKCAKQFGRRLGYALHYSGVVFDRIAANDGGQPKRAWLVEAASADDARELIRLDGMGIIHADEAPTGRILAQGGRQ